MVDDKMDYLSGAKSSISATEDEIGFKLAFIVFATTIALETVVLLPVVAQVIAFVVIFKWLKAKIFY